MVEYGLRLGWVDCYVGIRLHLGKNCIRFGISSCHEEFIDNRPFYDYTVKCHKYNLSLQVSLIRKVDTHKAQWLKQFYTLFKWFGKENHEEWQTMVIKGTHDMA